MSVIHTALRIARYRPGRQDKAERTTPKFAKFTDKALDRASDRIHRKLVEVIERARPRAMMEAKQAVGMLAAELADDPAKELEAILFEWLQHGQQIGIEAAKKESVEIGVTVNWETIVTDGADYLQDYSLFLAKKLTADAEFDLRYTIMGALLQGKGADGIATEIRKLGDDYYDRAKIIARSEGMRALNQGRMTSYQEMGVEEVAWIASDLACDQCRPMDGQIFALGEQPEIPLHPNCVLPGTVVDGGGIEAVLRALYSGPAIEIITGAGERLHVTPNHPIATPGGFVRAERLREGSYIFRKASEIALGANNDDQDGPTRIEKVFDLLAGFGTLEVVPASSPDLHGDARSVQGEIHIARADGGLRREGNTDPVQGMGQGDFMGADVEAFEHPGICPQGFLGRIDDPAPASLMSGRNLGLALGRVHPRPLTIFGAAMASGIDTSFPEDPYDGMARHAQLLRELVHRNPVLIVPDQIIHIRRYPFSGHVYDLQTATHIYLASNILTHNCRCTVGAVTQFTRREGDKVVWD